MWKAISRDTASDVEFMLKEISEIIINRTETNEIGLINGDSGIATFFYYYYKYTGDKLYQKYANDIYCKDFGRVCDGYNYPTYADGVCGILSTLGIIEDGLSGYIDEEEYVFPIEGYLKRNLELCCSNNYYDFLHGGLGYGIYFLSNPLRNKNIHKYLLNELKKSGIETHNGGIAWMHKNTVTKDVSYDLGLAHGISNIIYYLSNLCKYDIYKNTAKELLTGAVNYLIDNIQDHTLIGSYFPYSKNVDNTITPEKSRLAWCYGDLGIAMSLFQAGINSNTDKWISISKEIMSFSAKRRDLKQNLVEDAAICHGASGIGHMFQRMYNYTNEQEYLEAANYWLNVTLDFDIRNGEFKNYEPYLDDSGSSYEVKNGMLKGISGIGLFLISAVSDIEPSWDSSLLLS
jgi:lantibiotic modifying enzyme